MHNGFYSYDTDVVLTKEASQAWSRQTDHLITRVSELEVSLSSMAERAAINGRLAKNYAEALGTIYADEWLTRGQCSEIARKSLYE